MHLCTVLIYIYIDVSRMSDVLHHVIECLPTSLSIYIHKARKCGWFHVNVHVYSMLETSWHVIYICCVA